MENFVILQLIGIIVIKSKEKEWSPTPADILVGINPNSSWHDWIIGLNAH